MADTNTVTTPEIAAQEEGTGYWSLVIHRLRKRRLAVVSIVLLLLMILCVLIGPKLIKWDPNDVELSQMLQPPSRQHLLGTDDQGRDELARLFYGGRTSLTTGFVVTFMSGVLGVLVGLWAGYAGGIIDSILMRINEIMMTIPEFPLLIVAARMNFLANGPLKLIIILTVFGWVGVARLIRGNVISLREEEYVEAAKAIGASGWRVITRHLLPNTTATIIVWATLRVGLVIVTEATLSYFGLGIQPPLASWGNMLQGSQTYIWSAQWLVWWPGLCILLTTLFLNFIGDGLRDAMDPKLVL